MSEKNEQVLAALSEYLFEDNFTDMCEKFALEHCDVFDPDSDENKLEYKPIYDKFCQTFESKIEGFITKNDIPLEDFYTAIQEDHENESGVTEVLMALQEFDVFVSMMKEMAN
eukprot:CAMPEP_0117427980 /NCGR_PEP_ID=MMETSP0758-20121206/7764_1 /TAXON_ID=63605 /ORGANISM="Percolomonas cosmopolitus, Strain AE-1 (ATCC 50343)" /LENGTH=112 /DNA_ID=CAMNT_0005214031 /DNA_START=30 /DNA_END=365 /DNA_ORIENTATION=-